MVAKEVRGKLVIAVMLAVAVGMGTYSWWHQFQSGRRCAEFWGAHTAVVVRYGPHVEFVPIRRADSQVADGEVITIKTQPYIVNRGIDVTKWRGLVHARHALVDDLSYTWNASLPPDRDWEFLLRFRDLKQQVTVAFAPESGGVYFVDGQREIEFIPKIAAAFRQKRDEWRRALQ